MSLGLGLGSYSPNVPAIHEVPAEPDETALATGDGDIEAVIVSPQVESHVPPRSG